MITIIILWWVLTVINAPGWLFGLLGFSAIMRIIAWVIAIIKEIA